MGMPTVMLQTKNVSIIYTSGLKGRTNLFFVVTLDREVRIMPINA